MKLLIISSSPRGERSQSLILAKQAASGFGQKTAEIVHLWESKIRYCSHCENCHKQILDCPIHDDAMAILRKMIDSDAIVLASPDYISNVSAPMKALFDRSSHFIHCKRLAGKYTAGFVSSGSATNAIVTDYLKHYSLVCGAQFVGAVHSTEPAGEEKKNQAFELGRALNSAVKEKEIFKDQAGFLKENKDHFRLLMERKNNAWPGEYKYWKDRGWL